MKSEQKQFVSHQDASKNEFHSQPIDRRSFLQYAAGVGVMVGFGGSAFGQAQQDVTTDAAQPNHKATSTNSRLPDGTYDCDVLGGKGGLLGVAGDHPVAEAPHGLAELLEIFGVKT